jgi:hypothetical protein
MPLFEVIAIDFTGKLFCV